MLLELVLNAIEVGIDYDELVLEVAVERACLQQRSVVALRYTDSELVMVMGNRPCMSKGHS